MNTAEQLQGNDYIEQQAEIDSELEQDVSQFEDTLQQHIDSEEETEEEELQEAAERDNLFEAKQYLQVLDNDLTDEMIDEFIGVVDDVDSIRASQNERMASAKQKLVDAGATRAGIAGFLARYHTRDKNREKTDATLARLAKHQKIGFQAGLFD